MLYRILTEEKNEATVTTIVARYFDAFTMLRGRGCWKSQCEPCLIVEVETDKLEQVTSTALEIKRHNEQEKVMIQSFSNTAWLL